MDKETKAFRALLKRKGLNCRKVADALGVAWVTVRVWHCGREPVPAARLKQIREM